MSANAMSLKAKLKNLAKEKNVKPQVLLQNYMFERFLERLSLSEYEDRFVLKGGMLIASIVGADMRSTMDLDATIRGLPLDESSIRNALSNICKHQLNDEVALTVGTIKPIRPDDIYGGYRAKMLADYDTITIPFSIDITTGDKITPQPIRFVMQGILEEEKHFMLWAYNIETIMAEKIETILRRQTLNTRARDFYDVYILSTTQVYDPALLKDAVFATAAHRGTTAQIADIHSLLTLIQESDVLRQMWEKYCREFDYAANISYKQLTVVLREACATLL